MATFRPQFISEAELLQGNTNVQLYRVLLLLGLGRGRLIWQIPNRFKDQEELHCMNNEKSTASFSLYDSFGFLSDGWALNVFQLHCGSIWNVQQSRTSYKLSLTYFNQVNNRGRRVRADEDFLGLQAKPAESNQTKSEWSANRCALPSRAGAPPNATTN